MLKRFAASFSLTNWVVIILLIGIPLYPKFRLFNVPGTYVAVRLEDFFIAACFVLWLFLERRKIKQLITDRTVVAMISFLAVGLLSLSSALLVTHTVQPHLGMLHWARRVEYMLPFLFVLTSVRSVVDVKAYIITLFATAIAVDIYGFGQKFAGWPVISTMNEEFSKGTILSLTSNARVNSTFAGHYDLAFFLSIVILLGVALWFVQMKKVARILLVGTLIITFILLLFTVSQVAYLAMFCGVIFVLVKLEKQRIIVALVGVAIVVALGFPPLRHRLLDTLFVNIAYFTAKLNTTMMSPLVEITDQVPGDSQRVGNKPLVTYDVVEQSASHSSTAASVSAIVTPLGSRTPDLGVIYSSGVRFDVEWPRATRAFIKNPLLGTGYSSIGLSTDNDYLRLLGEVGLLGSWAFGLVIVSLLLKAIAIWRLSPPPFVRQTVVACVGIGIVFAVGALFIDVFEASKIATIFWMLAGIVAGLYKLSARSYDTV